MGPVVKTVEQRHKQGAQQMPAIMTQSLETEAQAVLTHPGRGLVLRKREF